jgi:uncharacterized repeat protein (TIGR01451 family)
MSPTTPTSNRAFRSVGTALVVLALSLPLAPVRAEDSRKPDAGLKAAATGRCKGHFEVEGTGQCSHGTDMFTPAQVPAEPLRARATAVVCDTDPSAKRVQLLYVRGSSVADQYATTVGQIRQWAELIDGIVDASAAETGAIRRVRYVMDGSCNVDVANEVLTDTQAASLSAMTTELQARGYNRDDRKYAAFVDSTSGQCKGVASLWMDDSAGATNLNNSRATYARAEFPGCSFSSTAAGYLMAHELMHTFGGVQDSAPHSTSQFAGSGGHCYDEWDRMCYKDGGNTVLQTLCPDAGHDNLFDCNHDDYFHAGTPPAGNYLATHWNTANSGWLIAAAPTSTDLSLTNVESQDPVPPSSSLIYTLTVANRGGLDASGVTLTDTLPVSLTFVSASSVCSGTSTVVCDLGAIPASGSAQVQITVTTGGAGTVSNTATVTSATPDPNTANDSATAVTSVSTTGPDYAGAWAAVPTRTCSTRRCSISGALRVSNAGNVATPKRVASVRYLLSADSTPDPGDQLLKTAALSAIAPGASRTLSMRIRLGPGVPAGMFVIAVLDATNAVAETNEGNNAAAAGPIP